MIPSAAVARRAHQVWVDFISTGDPGWPAYDTTTRSTGVLGADVTVVGDPSADERVLWHGIR